MASRPDPAAHGQRPGFERRVLVLALLSGLPGVALALVLLWTGHHSAKVVWTFTLLVLVGWGMRREG